MSPPHDTIARLKRGDRDAFNVIYDQHGDRVFGFLVRMTGSRALAEDLFQDTWIRLARSAASLADDTNIGAWLFTVARNLVYSHSRWLSTSRAAVRELEKSDLGARSTTPYHSAELSQTQALLEQGLGQLRPKYREAIILVAIEGLSPTEAATIAGASPEAMRQRLSRARMELGRALDASPREPAKKGAQS